MNFVCKVKEYHDADVDKKVNVPVIFCSLSFHTAEAKLKEKLWHFSNISCEQKKMNKSLKVSAEREKHSEKYFLDLFMQLEKNHI